MAELNIDKMAHNVAEKALDEFLYDGKSIREWMQIIASGDAISRQAALRQSINAYKMAQENGFDFKIICEEYLNVLPPVTPQGYCDDEYIKIPKNALKYRTSGMVAYNAEWLKNHFDIERAVICGVQQPYDDIKQKIFNAIDNVPITLSRSDANNLLKMDIQNIIDEYKAESEDNKL